MSSTSMPSKQNPHTGHRLRLRGTFLNHGLDVLPDVNVLELLLFYVYPRQDTNPIAHRLLNTFGSLDAVLSASVADLTGIGGLSENAAALIRLVPDLARRQQLAQMPLGTILDSPQKYGEFLIPYFARERDECIYLLALDSKCKVIDCHKLSTGSVNCVGLSIRDTVAYALRVKATSIIVSHNHTSGVAVPSQEDIDTTRALSQALALVGVLLTDHIVVAGNDFTSMLQNGTDFRAATPDAIFSGTAI